MSCPSRRSVAGCRWLRVCCGNHNRLVWKTNGLGAHPGLCRAGPGAAGGSNIWPPKIASSRRSGRGWLKLSDAERATLAEIGHRLGRKILAEVACPASLALRRRMCADAPQHMRRPGTGKGPVGNAYSGAGGETSGQRLQADPAVDERLGAIIAPQSASARACDTHPWVKSSHDRERCSCSCIRSLCFAIDLFKPRCRLEVENPFLRHQVSIALRAPRLVFDYVEGPGLAGAPKRDLLAHAELWRVRRIRQVGCRRQAGQPTEHRSIGTIGRMVQSVAADEFVKGLSFRKFHPACSMRRKSVNRRPSFAVIERVSRRSSVGNCGSGQGGQRSLASCTISSGGCARTPKWGASPDPWRAADARL